VAMAAIALTVFVMFILSQMVLYIQIKRMEKAKEYKEITQDYILPYLNEIFLFLELKLDVRKETGVPMIDINPEEIVTKLQEKIRYGNARILNALYRYFNSAAYFEGRGEAKNLATYDVFYHFLDHAYHIIEKSGFKDEELLGNIEKWQKIYGMAFVLTSILGNDEAIKILSFRWLWSPDFLNKIPFHLLDDLIDNYNHSTMEEHKLLEFLAILKKDFQKSPEIDRFQELKNYLEEAFMIVEKRWLNYSS